MRRGWRKDHFRNDEPRPVRENVHSAQSAGQRGNRNGSRNYFILFNLALIRWAPMASNFALPSRHQTLRIITKKSGLHRSTPCSV